jgi:ATP-dependent DNA helicase MPH1
MKLSPDLLEAKHWIYPLNKPKRDYQFNIVRHCLFENTLVALPTGLGKTFIAGVVMLNCMLLHRNFINSANLLTVYRWYPNGKVVFVAPTKPLVAQQIDACHRTCGIPGTYAVELTGQTPRSIRVQAVSSTTNFESLPSSH